MEFKIFDTLEGKALILGPGFDYKCMILLDDNKKNLIIRTSQPSRSTDENYPYDNLIEYCVLIKDVETILKNEDEK